MSGNAPAAKIGAALVVGGGIGGMEAALDLAESGLKVYLVDSKPSIGGVMSQLDKTFPTNDCAMCTMAPRLVSIGRHKDIEVLGLSRVEKIEGAPGRFTVTLTKKARGVRLDKCTGCGTCVSNCPARNKVQPLPPAANGLDPRHAGKVREIVARNRGRDGPLMPILQEINAALYYLPEDALRYVAGETGYPLSHVLSIATFYGAFSTVPRGRHLVNVCMGTACYVKGSERLMEKFSQSLKVKPGGTTEDRLFTLQSARCIGCCGLAPAVMVGDAVFARVKAGEIPKIVARYREAG